MKSDRQFLGAIKNATVSNNVIRQVYVWKDVVGGLRDGSSKANAFASMTEAITAIMNQPHYPAYTFNISRGGTPYNEGMNFSYAFFHNTKIIMQANNDDLVNLPNLILPINSCAANTTPGRIVISDNSLADVSVGDWVWAYHLNGITIDDAFRAQVTQIGSGYAQTSETTKIPTTGWNFQYTVVCFDGTGLVGNTYGVRSNAQRMSISLLGIALRNYYSGVVLDSFGGSLSLQTCLVENCASREISVARASFESSIYYIKSGAGSNVYSVYLKWVYSPAFYYAIVDGPGLASNTGVYIESCERTSFANSFIRNFTTGIYHHDCDILLNITGISNCTTGIVTNNKSSVGISNDTIMQGVVYPFVGNGCRTFSSNVVIGDDITDSYYISSGSLVTITLPLFDAWKRLGRVIRIAAIGSGGFKLAQNAGDVVKFGAQTTTTGTGGYISGPQYSSIEIQYAGGGVWIVTSHEGELTVV